MKNPEEEVNLDWSECQDLWHGRSPRGQLANKNKTTKEVMPRRESPEEEFPEDRLSKKKKYKGMARCKNRKDVLKPPTQEPLDMPGINLRY